MIRLAILLALACTAFSAEMVHQRVVLKGGEELVGWWCADQGVLYLDNGKRRLLNKPGQVVRAEAVAPPSGQPAPKRLSFKRLPDLPFCTVTNKDGVKYVGWYDADIFKLWPHSAEADPFAIVFGQDGVASVAAAGSAPVAMPETARQWLDQKAVEFTTGQ